VSEQPQESGSDRRRALESLSARRSPLASPVTQLAQLEDLNAELDFNARLAAAGWPDLGPAPLEIFQINLGKLCNMTCRHCHVDAGPDRSDAMMSRETIESCLRALDRTTAHTVDLTGGAPELHPEFRYVVEQAVGRGKHVVDRCNLSVLLLPRSAGLIDWLGERGVEIVASLPHYRKRNTDAQRGDGAYDKSIEALRRLNAAGYGKGDPRRMLTLMSNPAGAFLAPSQAAVEQEWKSAMQREWGITFDRLFALNNMPISRFLEWLVDTGNLESYMQRLVTGFNPAAVAGLMCRNTISVSWDGHLYDCDFNQMLELDARPADREMRVDEFDPVAWQSRRIVTKAHCFGCTAGAGSSCGGATT
jgi:radical SAM/Cys-rich protein